MGYIQPLLIGFIMKTTSRIIVATLGVFALSGASLLAQESVTIPMATYQDLLDRLDSLEKRVSQAERVSAPTSSGKSIDDEIVYLPNASKAVTMPSRGGLYTNYEYVHAKPVYSTATAFYVHDNVVTAADGAELYEFRPDMEGSHRLELGYLNPVTNIGWRTRYWQFSSDSRLASSTVDVKVGIADDPDIGIDSVGAGNDYYIATAGTDLDVIDLERFERKASAGKATTVGFGVRYARVQNYYTGRDVSPITGDQAPTGDVEDDEILRHFNSFQGAGPTISIDMQRQIGNSKLSWDFGGRASALFGSSRARWEADYTPGGELSDVIEHGENIRVLPVTEAQLGLLYEHETRRGKFIDVGAGFEGQYWLGGGTPLDAGQDSASDSDHISPPSSHNIGILGFYFKIGAEF